MCVCGGGIVGVFAYEARFTLSRSSPLHHGSVGPVRIAARACACVRPCVSSSVGVSSVHNKVAIPNSLLGLPRGTRPYPETYSRCSFNKHCRCRAIESRARLQSMAISCATQSANELCKYYRGPQSLSVTVGRLRHNDHRLQVADTIVALARESRL